MLMVSQPKANNGCVDNIDISVHTSSIDEAEEALRFLFLNPA